MTLLQELKKAKTEEDVKDAYVRAIGLKNYSKNLVDIQTKEVWFEAKDAGTSPVAMFAQLLFYVREAKRAGEHLPPFLCVIDREKAALMETANALPLFDDKSVTWPMSASKAAVKKKTPQEFVTKVSGYISAHSVSSFTWALTRGPEFAIRVPGVREKFPAPSKLISFFLYLYMTIIFQNSWVCSV